jgi:hypothetical protein
MTPEGASAFPHHVFRCDQSTACDQHCRKRNDKAQFGKACDD